MVGEIEKIAQNPDKATIIRESHMKRREFLGAIQRADWSKVQELAPTIYQIVEKDKVDLLKRIEGDTLRSYKNFMLSHNSMYALVAEIGGLDPVLSHYMSEKYAIIIESASRVEELALIHDQLLRDYASPENRIKLEESKSLSADVLYYISVNFMNSLEVQTIADKFYMTREHLMRTFKKETGKTVHEAIKEKQLSEATYLLEHTKLAITDIAIMTGFNSSQYFSKVFKETYECSPTQYRNKKN